MRNTNTSLRSNTKRARGLGASHHGTGHWWLQRLSAVGIVPLSIWFMVVLVNHLVGADAATIATWLKSPFSAIGLLLLVIALFTHARLGVQVIIEDYVHSESKKIALLLVNNAAIFVAGLVCIFSILRLHFIGV